MGTINYRTSDYITLAVRPYDREDFLTDADFMREYGEEEIDRFIYMYTEDDYYNIKALLEKHEFCYYHVTLEMGYYEGFSLDIENNFSIYYDDYIEKREAQKEITEIKQFLVDCVNSGMVQCFPSWGTTYLDREESLQGINNAIKAMREEAKKTPTWAQYEREGV